MKIEIGEEDLGLHTEGILERLYLEDRLGLKHEGDTAKCEVVYKGSYVDIKISKREEKVIKC
jgi:hypothetical protein